MATESRFLKRLVSMAAPSASEVNWQTVYAQELPRIYNFFRYRVGDNATAEDLSSLTFEKAWRSRFRYRRDLAAFSTWLLTIARNVAADYYRKEHAIRKQNAGRRFERSLAEIHQPTGEDTPLRSIEQSEHLARLAQLLAALPDRDRELLALKYGAEMTNRAIAQLTGLTESNVGTILHRVINNLREQWTKDE